jgi:CheY-like chemotaxis protein
MGAEAIRILVIDDDATVRTLARVILETAGYHVQEAADGSVGISHYRQLRPDLVITDIMMPEMEGFETILALRRVDPTVRIVAMTAADQQRGDVFLESAEMMGAVRSLRKPFLRQELLTIVSETLAT